MCRVVNIRDSKNGKYIGRAGNGEPGDFGNEFIVGKHGEQGECVEKFRIKFYSPAGKPMRDRVKAQIKVGDVLICHCKPKPCHGDVIAEYVNNGYKDLEC